MGVTRIFYCTESDHPYHISEDLRRRFGVDDNYEVEDRLKAQLPIDVCERIIFDSETCEFVAYCSCYEVANAIITLIDRDPPFVDPRADST